MKKSVLSRYERDEGGNIIIDVSAARIEDLYNNFDKSAQYIRRDLDQDFAHFLISGAREVGKLPFIVRLTLDTPPSESDASRIRGSLNSYFSYLAEVEFENVLQMFRRSAILLAIGLAILFVSVWLNESLASLSSVTANVFSVGLTVAAWVSLWEALAVFLVEWFPYRKKILIYRRIAASSLVLRGSASASENAPNNATA